MQNTGEFRSGEPIAMVRIRSACLRLLFACVAAPNTPAIALDITCERMAKIGGVRPGSGVRCAVCRISARCRGPVLLVGRRLTETCTDFSRHLRSRLQVGVLSFQNRGHGSGKREILRNSNRNRV
jgi:hypothetical protein